MNGECMIVGQIFSVQIVLTGKMIMKRQEKNNFMEINMITVSEFIEKLKEFPQDMPVGIEYNPFDEIEIEIKTWEHTNYPYNKPDLEFVNIQ